MLAETGSARSSDCILDRAYFARLEKLAKDSNLPYLQSYVRAMIDAADLRALVRTLRLGLDMGFLKQVLFPGGSVAPEAILANAAGGCAPLWRGTAFAQAAELGDAAISGGSLTAFEKACDDAVMKAAGTARRVPFGAEVALGYLAAKGAEWTAVRTVLSGRMAGVPADALRERLREQYV